MGQQQQPPRQSRAFRGGQNAVVILVVAVVGVPVGNTLIAVDVVGPAPVALDQKRIERANTVIPAYSPNARFQSARERVGDGFDLFRGFGTASS
ncbi:hypothetical protein, partial [Phaeovulum veldkampii]|uniref:hypothetical protein n=1 Tax=Phaeovulum veldkampii TaxID=33049 RepID=UPI001B3BB456